MPNDHVELVSLLSVMSAAERGLSPLGPEFAGFVVLESAQRVREAGGGIATARELAIDVGGQVHLVAQPARGDDARSTEALRALLGALLETATSSTPALRACARRKETTTSASLVRELQAALIPLNRAASRRGVARVAKSTAEALAKGSIGEPSLDAPAGEPSPSPVRVAPVSPATAKVAAPLTPLPSVIVADETTPCDAGGPWVGAVGATPVTLAEIERTVHDPRAAPIAASAVLLDDTDFDAIGEEPEPFEVVSSLPPIVALATAEPAPAAQRDDEDSPRAAFAVPLAQHAERARSPVPASENRVEALLAGFSVSRLRDDPALSRDLKAMIGIETAGPPAVAPRDLRESASSMAVDLEASPDELGADDETPAPDDVSPRRGGRRGLALFSFLVLGAGIAIGVTPRTRDAVRAMFSPPSPPPGDVAGSAPTTPARPAASVPIAPLACEGTLSLEGVPPGAEVVRKLGVAPTTASVPTHVPLDLVGVAPGMPPRRVHVDPSAAWSTDLTGPRLEVPVMLDIGAATAWPARVGDLSPAPLASPAGRGTLRVVGNPPGTTIWLSVTPGAIAAPCGSPVELMVIVPPSAPRTLRVEWSAFAGSPPRATSKL